MSDEEQTALDKIRKTNDNGMKLEEIYRMLGKRIEDIDLFFRKWHLVLRKTLEP